MTAAARVRGGQVGGGEMDPRPVRPAGGHDRIELVIAGRTYPVGHRVDGDTPWEASTREAAAVTIPIRDTDGTLMAALTTPEGTVETGTTLTLDGVTYGLADLEADEDLVVLTFEDLVAWRLRQYRSYRAEGRDRVTRAGFVRGLCLETGAGAGEPVRWWIPEHRDVQPIARQAA